MATKSPFPYVNRKRGDSASLSSVVAPVVVGRDQEGRREKPGDPCPLPFLSSPCCSQETARERGQAILPLHPFALFASHLTTIVERHAAAAHTHSVHAYMLHVILVVASRNYRRIPTVRSAIGLELQRSTLVP